MIACGSLGDILVIVGLSILLGVIISLGLIS